MVPIVQLVRASDCGSECRGFESHWAPKRSIVRSAFSCVQWGENPGFAIDELTGCIRKMLGFSEYRYGVPIPATYRELYVDGRFIFVLPATFRDFFVAGTFKSTLPATFGRLFVDGEPG